MDIKFYRTNVKDLIFKIVVICFILSYFSRVFATSYMYNVKSQKTNVDAVTDQIGFEFQSKSQVLMEPTTGTIIYAGNENEKILPASVTKVMTLLLAMEAIDSGKLQYTDSITCSANASKMGGSQIWFKEGEKLTVDEALKCVCVVSANDVTVAMAEHLGGSEENFVKQMNIKAKELGMSNTNFMNAHGIDEENHYTTALDIAIMSRELVTKHPNILKYTSIWMDSIRDGTFNLSNTNKLIRFYDGALGLKTGSTSQALFSLSGLAKRDDTMFISVVCTAPTSDIRNEEVKQLLDYGFANYKVQNIYKLNDTVDNVDINKNLEGKIDVVVDSDVSVLGEKGKEIEFDSNIQYYDLKAPISSNTAVGKIVITDKTSGSVISEKEVIVKQDVSKSNVLDYFLYMSKKLLTLN